MPRPRKTTAHRPSQADQEFVTNSRGEKVRNTAYDPKAKKNTRVGAKQSPRGDFGGDAKKQKKSLGLTVLSEVNKTDLIDSYDLKDRDYFRKSRSTFFTLRGKVAGIHKPAIKKSFWVAEYGYDYDEKQQVAHTLSSNEQLFIENNMAEAESTGALEHIDDYFDTGKQSGSYFYATSLYDDDGVEVRYYDANNYYQRYDRDYGKTPEELGRTVLTDEEVKDYKKLCEQDQKKFEKRLHSYLKRYGMRHVHANTYWGDR